ncbi:hypothetical protein SLEP1_g57919 [Rubroshorea leprosula]|uniref:Uncharacterized protein n=1 Tax=Rubroshorea leprosula TaxID=152421 RepID=A0AAV5MR91_9ROSI|nr:hypothetical protein SLEP1_g57919 [Rubroshorea leprosula]
MTGISHTKPASETIGCCCWSGRMYLGGIVVKGSLASSWTQGTGREFPQNTAFDSMLLKRDADSRLAAS